MKKKLRRIIASSAIISSIFVGTVLANSNAGANIISWYELEIEQTKNNIQTNVIDPKLAHLKEFLEEQKVKLVLDAKSKFQETEERTIRDIVWNTINSTTVDYRRQIQNKTMEITSGTIETDFDKFVAEENKETDQYLETEVANYISDLNMELQSEVESTKTNIENVSNQAQLDLKYTINETKDSLSKEIDIEKVQAEKELKQNLDEIIQTSKKVINQETESKQNKVIESLNNKGQEIENIAYQEMAQVISNIKN